MKILFLTPQLPYPPQQGTTIRNFNIIKGLARRHELDLLSFGRPAELADSPLPSLVSCIQVVEPPARTLLRRVVETFVSPLPDMARRLHSPDLENRLLVLLSKTGYDIIQIEGIEMAAFCLLPQVRQETEKSHLVFDDHNAEYVLQKTAYEADRLRLSRLPGAVYSFIQWHKLARFERNLCRRASRIVAVSSQDAAALTALDAQIQPVIIPNGVDVEYYVMSDAVCSKPLAELSIVFTGKMDFRPNVDAALWFANEILPLLRRQIPLAHISFVGQKPGPRVQALNSVPGIHVTGWVPDTRPYIADAAVYAVPLRMGGGTRLKVLEAMAMGKAVVSTTLGAAGIEYVRDRDLVIADQPEDFAEAIASLMRDPDRRRVLGANARQLAERVYDWNKLVPRFESIYASFQ